MNPRDQIEQRFADIEQNVHASATHTEAQTAILQNIQSILWRIFWVVSIGTVLVVLMVAIASGVMRR